MLSPSELDRIRQETFVRLVEQHDELESTQNRARELVVAADVAAPVLVLADRQSRGRGRRGARWWTGNGSLALSVGLQADLLPQQSANASLVALGASVAVVEALRPHAAGVTLGLHWPNDVYLGGKKVAGVLVERTQGGRTIIGLGINTNNSAKDAPADIAECVATLRDATGEHVEHAGLVVGLLENLERQLRTLRSDSSGLVRHVNELCLQRNQFVVLTRNGEALRGACRGIGEDGALLLETNSGTQRIVSGRLVRIVDQALASRA